MLLKFTLHGLFLLLLTICLLFTAFLSHFFSSTFLCPFIFDVSLVMCQILLCNHFEILQFCLLWRRFKSFPFTVINNLFGFIYFTYFGFTTNYSLLYFYFTLSSWFCVNQVSFHSLSPINFNLLVVWNPFKSLWHFCSLPWQSWNLGSPSQPSESLWHSS